MKKMVTYLAAFSMVLSMLPVPVSAAETSAYDSASVVTADASQSSVVDMKDLAGRWRYEEAKSKYSASLCAEYAGVIDVKEDGTYVYHDASGTESTGRIVVTEEVFTDGTRFPVISFNNGTTDIFSGYYKKGADVISGGNGDASHIVRDRAWTDGTEQLAVERMNNYRTM